MASLRAAILCLCFLAGSQLGSCAPQRERRTHGWIVSSTDYDLDESWARFKKEFRRSYASEAEEAARKAVFHESIKRAIKRNDMNVVAGGQPVFGVTKFSDMTQAHFDTAFKGRKGRGKYDQKDPATGKVNAIEDDDIVVATPSLSGVETLDWTSAGYTTPVKNQGQCGSCWAHSAVEQIESTFMLAGEAPWLFSVQQVNSCTSGTFGCGGGDTVYAYEQLMSNETKTGTEVPGLASDAFVPYEQSMYEECVTPFCTEACTSDGVGDLSVMEEEVSLTGPYVGVSGYSYATTPCTGTCNNQNLTLLNDNLASAPASICVNAELWNDYVGGVLMTDACGGYGYYDLDHCVQLTGYNLSADEPYYLVRNSWATNWGVDGYILLSSEGNTCGLADEATFVDIIIP